MCAFVSLCECRLTNASNSTIDIKSVNRSSFDGIRPLRKIWSNPLQHLLIYIEPAWSTCAPAAARCHYCTVSELILRHSADKAVFACTQKPTALTESVIIHTNPPNDIIQSSDFVTHKPSTLACLVLDSYTQNLLISESSLVLLWSKQTVPVYGERIIDWSWLKPNSLPVPFSSHESITWSFVPLSL